MTEAGCIGDTALRDPPPEPGTVHYVMDPSVVLFNDQINGHHFLLHGYFETALAIPPGEGLLDLVADFSKAPVSLQSLCAAYSEHSIVDTIAHSLFEAGFVHAIEAPYAPKDDIDKLRSIARQRLAKRQVPVVRVDLDQSDAFHWPDASSAKLVLRCLRLADHHDRLEALEHAARNNDAKPRDITIYTHDPVCNQQLCGLLSRLDAAIVVENVAWPEPAAAIDGLADLTRNCLSVHVSMAPGPSIFDSEQRQQAVDWIRRNFLTGLRLSLIPADIWPKGKPNETEIEGLLDLVHELEEQIGDLIVDTVPLDDVILGLLQNEAAGSHPSLVPFRQAYTRRRIGYLKSWEGDNLWSQIPEVEDQLVPLEDDLLPNNPDLLGLAPGAKIVDVCGGLGRVARRLSPAVGTDGQIISIELLRLISDRGRNFARERGYSNLSFRVGLAQRLPLPDNSVDAAVNEWTGGIWELGLGSTMLAEMKRVVRPGGRIAISHRLVRLPLAQLGSPWVQYEDIYRWINDSIQYAGLEVVTEQIWGQISPPMVGQNARQWRKQYIPPIIDPFDFTYQSEENSGKSADIFLTIIAAKAFD